MIVAPPQDYELCVSGRKTTKSDPPYGAMYIAGSLMQEGHQVSIEALDIERVDDAELSRRIEKFAPDIIGISAILSTSYKYVKNTSEFIKRVYPHIKIILGGGLGAAAELVLNKTAVDVVVIGEGDITVKELAAKMARKETYEGVHGIAFRDGGKVIITLPRRPIADMDILGYPAFDLVDMDSYMMDTKKFLKASRHYKNPDKRFFDKHRSRKMLRTMVSRGCINSCTFCYRITRGLRHFSTRYIGDYIEYLMDRFGVNAFSFDDECFAPNKEWNWEFINEIRGRKLDIIFQILGMRIDTVDYDILRAYKDAGCFMIEYGIESGSQKMLDIMEKNVTVQQNIDVSKWTRKAGIYMCPNLVLGMPGETNKTIDDNISFLKEIGYGPYCYQYSYAFALPGSPLYDYARLTGLVKDEDAYLEDIYYADMHTHIFKDTFVNYTSQPLAAVRSWPEAIKDALLRHYNKNRLNYFINKTLKLDALYHALRSYGLKKTIAMIWLSIANVPDKNPAIKGTAPTALASSGVTFEETYALIDKRRISLRHVIEKMAENIKERDDNRETARRKVQV